MLLASTAVASSQEQILRVGVVDGSAPCSYLTQSAWRGISVDLWRLIAAREGIPYKISEWPSITAMLDATRDGRLDVAVECINISPDRLGRYQFSLPFQEDGQAVMTGVSPFNYGSVFLKGFFSVALLRLLGAFSLVTFAICALIWKIERYGTALTTKDTGVVRSFAGIFLSTFAGAGIEKIVKTTRGNALASLAYLVRCVFISLLVGYITINLVKESENKATGGVERLEDLIGLRVGIRAGTVSESLLTELNAVSSRKAEAVPLNNIASAMELLEQHKLDAILADELQLRYLRSHRLSRALVISIPVKRIRPESQAFAFSPDLSPATTSRINQAISLFKRSGVVSSLTEANIDPPATKEN
jgi:ABC-type amino acid transport substrate-binding protein